MIHAREDYNLRVQDSENIIPEDEPVFLLRGQDMYAYQTVMYWCKAVEMGGNKKLADHVRCHADVMFDWPNKKRPDKPDNV